VQIRLLRKASVVQRASLALSLSRSTSELAWRAIERAHPSAGEQEIGVLFVAIHYGQGLADRLSADLEKRGRG
jgi:hypothetical protein